MIKGVKYFIALLELGTLSSLRVEFRMWRLH